MTDSLSGKCQQNAPQNSCPLSCLVCSNNTLCVVCKPFHYLVVQGTTNACIRKNILFRCPAPGYALSPNGVCYPNDSSTLSALSRCTAQISNCQVCLYLSVSSCLLCSPDYLLQDNACVKACSENYYQTNQACILSVPNCKQTSFNSGTMNTSLNVNAVIQNPGYLKLTQAGKAPLNEPYGYQLYIQRYYKLANYYDNLNTLLFWSTPQCRQCQNGYGLTNDFKCEKCPLGCFLCLYSHTCIANT